VKNAVHLKTKIQFPLHKKTLQLFGGGELLFIARTINNTKIHNMDCNVTACGTYNYYHTSKL